MKSAGRNLQQVVGLQDAGPIRQKFDAEVVRKHDDLMGEQREIEDGECDGRGEHGCIEQQLAIVIVDGHDEGECQGLNDENDQPAHDQSDSPEADHRTDQQRNGHPKTRHIKNASHRHRAREGPCDPPNREEHEQEGDDRKHSLAHRLRSDECGDFSLRDEGAGRELCHLVLGHIREEGKQIREVRILGGVVEIAKHPEVEGLCRRVFPAKTLD